MALVIGEYIIPDGPPSGGIQFMKSASKVVYVADRTGQANQSILSSVRTRCEFNVETIDQGGFYDPVLFEWTPSPGTYIMKAQVGIILLDSNNELDVRILKNGVEIYFGSSFSTTNNQSPVAAANGITIANGTDIYTIEIEHDQGSALDMTSDPVISYVYGIKILEA